MIDPGQMRTRLIYQTPTEVGNEDGDKDVTWADQFRIWARVRPVQGDEAVRNDQTTAEVRYEVVCRYRAGIVPTGRFLVLGSGQILNVEGVVDWEMRGVELTITCVERFGAVA